jgi:hypothetical protein
MIKLGFVFVSFVFAELDGLAPQKSPVSGPGPSIMMSLQRYSSKYFIKSGLQGNYLIVPIVIGLWCWNILINLPRGLQQHAHCHA